jgi:hypothetical protein
VEYLLLAYVASTKAAAEAAEHPRFSELSKLIAFHDLDPYPDVELRRGMCSCVSVDEMTACSHMSLVLKRLGNSSLLVFNDYTIVFKVL